MATPARNLILENIATVLATITTANGYKTEIGTVERTVKDWDSVGAGEMPWLGFMPRRERIAHDSFEGMNITMPVSIVGHVNASTDALRSDLISDLEDDVIKALQTDTTRDGNAVMTTFTEAESDEGDPDTIDSRGGSGSFEMVAEIFYLRTTSGS